MLTTEQQFKLKQQARSQFVTSIELKQQVLEGDYLDTLVIMAERIVQSIANGGKLMLCGNGGSAADAQHLVAELLVRLHPQVNRKAIPAMALALDTSTITACANDYNFESLYERVVQGLGRKGDVLLGLTTSGRSKNVIRALQAAREQGIVTLGFLGSGGGDTTKGCDVALIVPSSNPNRVQEVHITLGHILMEMIEALIMQ